MRKILIGAALSALALSTPAHANLNVFACEPEWGALSSEIGGDKVSVYTATTGAQTREIRHVFAEGIGEVDRREWQRITTTEKKLLTEKKLIVTEDLPVGPPSPTEKTPVLKTPAQNPSSNPKQK